MGVKGGLEDAKMRVEGRLEGPQGRGVGTG